MAWRGAPALGRVLAAIIGGGVVGAVALGVVAVENPPSPVLATASVPLPSVSGQLEAAKAAGRFPVAELARPGGGLRLEASAAQIEPAYLAVDQWAVDADGRRWHLWQSNSSEIAGSSKDPVALGAVVQIGSNPWSRSAHAEAVSLLIYSARLPDGRTVSLDARASAAEVEALIARLFP